MFACTRLFIGYVSSSFRIYFRLFSIYLCIQETLLILHLRASITTTTTTTTHSLHTSVLIPESHVYIQSCQ